MNAAQDRRTGAPGGEIEFADTTLRDGQMSLWATNMTTAMILPVAPSLEQAGFKAAEVVGSAFFKKCVRDLREDPWERIRQVKALMPSTPLRAICSRHMAAFQLTPPAVTRLWMQQLAANGVSQIRMSDPSNTVENWAANAAVASEMGLETVLNVIFSDSPKHTDAYYAERSRAAARLPVAAICLKDPGGLMTPDRARTLIPVFLEETRGASVEFHTHCTTGYGPLTCIEAAKLGVARFSTAIPPLANGSSNPSVYSLARNLRALGFATAVDESVLESVTAHFERVARRRNFPLGAPVEYDAAYFRHQVPGGMISNLRSQLAQAGLEDRLEEVLEETARVREDLGYPIMVTPYSQFVGTQAAVNVMAGARYEQVIDEVIQYALGHWGAEESQGVDPDVKDRIVNTPRGKELRDRRTDDLSVADLRRQLGSSSVSDDELLLWYFAGKDSVEAMRDHGPGMPMTGGHWLIELLAELGRRRDFTSIAVHKGGFALSAVRAGEGRPGAPTRSDS